MGHPIKEQVIRQRLNWFRRAHEVCSLSDTCVYFGILRKTSTYNWGMSFGEVD